MFTKYSVDSLQRALFADRKDMAELDRLAQIAMDWQFMMRMNHAGGRSNDGSSS